MTEDLDEFEQFKAMAFNQNRRGSQSMPCTPQIPSRGSGSFKFTRERETSKSERRRQSTKRRHGHSHIGEGASEGPLYENRSLYSGHDMVVCHSASGDLNERLSRLSMTEIWVRRLRMRHGSTSDYDDQSPSPEISVHSPEHSVHRESTTPVITRTHQQVGMRRSNPEACGSLKVNNFGKDDHRRSMSCRDRTRNKHYIESDLVECTIRPRTYSVPSKAHIRRPDSLPVKHSTNGSPKENGVEYYIVRTFSTSKKGLINRGDSLKRRKTPVSADGVAATTEGTKSLSQASSAGSLQSSAVSSEPPVLRVLMAGVRGVGKSSLLQQFTSSDYLANMRLDSVPEPEEEDKEQKVVSVLLDEEECSLTFNTATHLQTEDNRPPPNAYVIVYSVSDRDTFEAAIDMLAELRMCGTAPTTNTASKRDRDAAIILVANKGDMVRSRCVLEEEGKEMAVSFDCKYIEVSALMNLRVDELLAGIVKQIQLTNVRTRSNSGRRKRNTNSVGIGQDIVHPNGCIEQAARGIVGRLFRRTSPVFRSCDNLLVA